MHPKITAALNFARKQQPVPQAVMAGAVGAIMDGECDQVEMAALLTALAVKGEAVSEIVGAVNAMIDRCEMIPTDHTDLLDTCGTGGDCLKTFNISTATAIVAAAAGIRVAKHGNRSVSSSSGSADVLEALGVNIQLTPVQVAKAIDEIGIGFCFAPLMHGAVKHVVPVRKKLVFRTIFNLLGPLANPAKAAYQLIGANRVATAEKLANSLTSLGRKRCLVVCGNDELDEVSLWGETTVFLVQKKTIESFTWTAASFGLPETTSDQLRVDSREESAAVIKSLFAGEKGPHRDIVVANSAAALIAAEKVENPRDAAEIVQQILDSGKAMEILEQLRCFV